MLPRGREIFRAASRIRRLGSGDGSAFFPSAAIPSLKRKASNTWSAVQDTFLSTKEIFERHRVVFTVGTSVASVLTAWAGYSLRHHHESKVEKRLQSIEESMKKNSNVEREEIKRIVTSGSISTEVCVATAFTSLIIGYGLGWRGGSWYANRKFRREQLRLMGQIKPRGWQLLRKSLGRLRSRRTPHKATDVPLALDTVSFPSEQMHKKLLNITSEARH